MIRGIKLRKWDCGEERRLESRERALTYDEPVPLPFARRAILFLGTFVWRSAFIKDSNYQIGGSKRDALGRGVSSIIGVT